MLPCGRIGDEQARGFVSAPRDVFILKALYGVEGGSEVWLWDEERSRGFKG